MQTTEITGLKVILSEHEQQVSTFQQNLSQFKHVPLINVSLLVETQQLQSEVVKVKNKRPEILCQQESLIQDAAGHQHSVRNRLRKIVLGSKLLRGRKPPVL